MGNIISGIGGMIGAGAASRKADAGASIIGNQLATTTNMLQPYVTAGANVLAPMSALATGSPTGGGPNYVSMMQGAMPGMMSQAQLEQTPGYQFTRTQGLNAVAGSQAARGLGVSGAALKGAATYGTGLANTTYQNQFANAQQQFADYGSLNAAQQGNLTNQFSRLNSVASLGGQVGGALGQIGANMAAGQSNALTASGAAQAAGDKALFSGIGADVQGALGTPTSPGGSSIFQKAYASLGGS